MKIKRGTVNKDTGLVFAGYGKSYTNGEWWTTPEKYEARVESMKEAKRRKYAESPEIREMIQSRNKAWRFGEGREWTTSYDNSRNRRKSKNERFLKRYRECPEFREKSLEKNKRHRSTEHARQRESRYKSRPDRLEKRRRRTAERHASDFEFLLKKRIRNQLGKAIRDKGIRASKTLTRYAGAPISTIKRFIECQFVDGMSWHNRDKWHIDHFFPMALARDEASLKTISFFTNLRPMWASDNCRKNATPPTPQEMIDRLDFVSRWLGEVNTQNMQQS